MRRRNFLTHVPPALAALGSWQAPSAVAQAYPIKPIVIRVGFPPGGPVDAPIRDMLPALRRELGQSVVIENLPGANGSIAAMSVANAAPDGHTLLAIPGAELIMAPRVVANARYKPDSFRLAGLLLIADFLLLAAPQHTLKNAEQLVEQAGARRDNPMSLAHWGPGSGGQLASADLQGRTGIKLLDIPYRGVLPFLTDLGGGQVDLAFSPIAGPVIGMVKAGKVKAVAVASAQRHPQLPEVPTFAEAGGNLAGFEYATWTGFFVPRQVSDAALIAINRASNSYSQSAEGRERIASTGARVLGAMTLEQLSDFFRRDAEKYLRIADRLNLKPQ